MPDRSDRAARSDPPKDPPPNAPRADWRKKGAAAGKAPSSGPWSGRWTDRKPGDSNSGLLWHRLKLAAWGALFVVLLVGLFYYLFFLPTRVPLIAAAITDYGQLIPPNSLAAEDVEGLSQANRSNMDVIGVPKDYSSREGLRAYLGRQLERIVPGGPGKKTVLFYLSCHGVLDANGRPCLLLADSQPHDSKTWLPLEELLKDLRDHDRLKKLAAKKVLILDCGRIPSQWRLGILHNGFADKLAQAVEEIKDPNLAVLSAAGPGQTSYAAPELGKTVFAHFLVDGLEGAADDSGDGIIMLQELQNYLTASVSRWSTNNRADRQQTLLFPESANFPVAFSGTKGSATPAPLVVPDSQREGLAKLWKQHEKLRQGKAFQRNPVGWADLESQLVRLEELSLAGNAYTAEFDRVKGEVDGLLREFSSAVTADAVALSLPLLESWTGAPAVPPATAAKPFSKWRDDRAKAKPGEVVPPPKLPYPAAGAAAVQWLAKTDNHAQQKDVTDALQLVAAASGRGPADVVEVHFLRMLDAYLDGPEAAKRFATAIRVRDLAERAAAPTDERTQYWVQSLVDAADVRRRGAEDDLFVGDPTSLGEADSAWQQLLSPGDESPYAAALSTSRQVAEAYQLRDEAWSRIPALAQWLVEMHRDRPSSELDAALMTLIGSTHELGAALDGGAVAGAWTPPQQASMDAVKKALGQLDKAHADRCDYLLTEAGDDQETLLGIIRVLQVPLLSGEKRSHLADKMLKIMFAQRAAGSARPAAAGNGDGAKPAADLPEDSAWLAKLTQREHPALAILDRSHLKLRDGQLRPVQRFQGVAAKDKSPAELRVAQVNSLAAQGGELRALLADVRPAANTLFDESNRLLEAPRPEPPAVTRLGFSQADRMVRAAAGILVKRTWENSAEDPARRLQRADWHFAMLWQCARALDDFWGPSPGTKDADYFAVAANAALNSARGLCRNAASFQYRQADLRQLLERRKTAASAGPKPNASDLLLAEDEPNVPHSLTLPAVADLPAGEAAAFLKLPGARGALLERLDGQRQPIRRSGMPVDAAAEGKSLDYFVRNEPRLEESLYLEAAALYRGHVLSSPFAVGKQSRGDEVAYQRPIYKKPTIRVQGAANQTSSVMFIFDCSGSMGNEVDFENSKVAQLNVARRTFNKVLANLPDENYRIGLMIYGHTSGWRRTAGGKFEPVDPRGKIPQLHPSADVETVFRLTPLTDSLREDIRDKLNLLKPHGETPLYYALALAFAEFGDDSKSKHIIVITDGINEQSPDGPEKAFTTSDQVEKLIKAHPDVTVDIVAFNMEKERKDHPSEVQQLETIAKLAKRKLHDARNPSLLLKALEESLRRVQYSVGRQGAGASANRLELGRTWTFEEWDGKPGAFSVKSHGLEREASAEVVLEGGEAIQLEYDSIENRLKHSRYEAPKRFERRENIQDPAKADRRFYVSTHMPARAGRSATFFVSVQNADASKFSPRPKHIWAEITPVYTRPPEKVPMFHFYDLDFEPDRPVPVLQFRVPVWPAEARQAKVQLWFKVDDDAPPNWSSPIDKVDQKTFSVSGIAGLELEVQTQRGTDVSDPFVVNVTESDQAPLEMFGTRLEMTPPPDRIVHRYITEAKRVRHIFIYKDTTDLRTIQPSLRVTTRDRIVRDSVPVEPLTVTLPQD